MTDTCKKAMTNIFDVIIATANEAKDEIEGFNDYPDIFVYGYVIGKLSKIGDSCNTTKETIFSILEKTEK